MEPNIERRSTTWLGSVHKIDFSVSPARSRWVLWILLGMTVKLVDIQFFFNLQISSDLSCSWDSYVKEKAQQRNLIPSLSSVMYNYNKVLVLDKGCLWQCYFMQISILSWLKTLPVPYFIVLKYHILNFGFVLCPKKYFFV